MDNKIVLYLNEKKNKFGYYDYKICSVVDGTETRVANGLCDDYEVIGGNVLLYYGVSMFQAICGKDYNINLEIFVLKNNAHAEKVTDYSTLESE